MCLLGRTWLTGKQPAKIEAGHQCLPLQHILAGASLAKFITHALMKSLPFFSFSICRILHLLQEASSSLQDAAEITKGLNVSAKIKDKQQEDLPLIPEIPPQAPRSLIAALSAHA